jgi:hypothetical protein
MQEREIKRQATVTRERDVRIQSELWYTSDCLLKVAQQQPQGAAHPIRASLVFRAFAFEALLNWLGHQLIPHWKYLERLSPKDKLDLLAGLIGVVPDYGSRPWQILKDLFGFRNDIAHGKPEILTEETLKDLDQLTDAKIEFIQTEWEQFCTEENAVRAKEDLEKIANVLYEASGIAKKQKGPIGPFAFGFQRQETSLC